MYMHDSRTGTSTLGRHRCSGVTGAGLAAPRYQRKRKADDDSDDDEETAIAVAKALQAQMDEGSGRKARTTDRRTKEEKSGADLLTELLGIDISGLSTSKRRQKPISQFTDEDFKKEERELNLKKLRLEVSHLELRNEFFERFIPFADVLDKVGPVLEKVSTVLDHMIERNSGAIGDPSDQVQAVYSNGGLERDITDNVGTY